MDKKSCLAGACSNIFAQREKYRTALTRAEPFTNLGTGQYCYTVRVLPSDRPDFVPFDGTMSGKNAVVLRDFSSLIFKMGSNLSAGE
ncbi:MAG: hypothetical protein HQK83_05755 [Fibrobacteria bacterium]|nr:hypothetical protein [Fibrobacteria bacterium]